MPSPQRGPKMHDGPHLPYSPSLIPSSHSSPNCGWITPSPQCAPSRQLTQFGSVALSHSSPQSASTRLSPRLRRRRAARSAGAVGAVVHAVVARLGAVPDAVAAVRPVVAGRGAPAVPAGVLRAAEIAVLLGGLDDAVAAARPVEARGAALAVAAVVDAVVALLAEVRLRDPVAALLGEPAAHAARVGRVVALLAPLGVDAVVTAPRRRRAARVAGAVSARRCCRRRTPRRRS